MQMPSDAANVQPGRALMPRRRGRKAAGWVVERSWEWRFAASPEALWPYLADTARFNEAAGVGRYAVTDTPRADGTVARRGAVRALGLTLSWDEGVPNWIAGRHYSHHRHFHRGPLRGMAVAIDLDPEPGGGSRVRYRLGVEA